MKSMKLWMGLAVAVALGTGCGGDISPEDACGDYESHLKSLDTKLKDCRGPISFAAFYDEAACVEGLESCSSDDIEAGLAQLDCVADAMSCEAFETQAAEEEMEEKIAACESKYPVSASCEGPEVGDESVARKAMKMLRSR